jgi:hypothetical protein
MDIPVPKADLGPGPNPAQPVDVALNKGRQGSLGGYDFTVVGGGETAEHLV